MKREDFKEITTKYIKTAEEIIKDEGRCIYIDCNDCPFSLKNSIKGEECSEEYSTDDIDEYNEDDRLLKSAKDFLEMCKSTGAITGEGTVAEDNINSPKHYKLPGLNIESIDIIRAILGKYFKWFCLGNIIKYILRAEKKNGLED